MEESGLVEVEDSSKRKAAWWAWPLIVLCLIPLEPIFDRVAPAPKEVVAETDLTDLAMLKFQSQVAITMASLSPEASDEVLDDLVKITRGNRGLAGLALLESFIHPRSDRVGERIAKLEASPDLDWIPLVIQAGRNGINEGDREALAKKIGWFAKLARGPELADPPEAASIRRQSLVLVMVMGAVFCGAVTGILCGAVLLILHMRRVEQDASANVFTARAGRYGPFIEAFALYLGIMTLASIASIWLGLAAGIAGYLLSVVVPLVWPRVRGMRWSEVRDLIGLHRGRGILREIAAGAVGYLGVLAIASIGILITVLISMVAGILTGPGDGKPVASPEAHPIVGWFFIESFWLHVGTFALAAIYAPLVEEIFFRGMLYRYFRGRFRFLVSALFASLIFAALHPQGVYGIPALAGIGVGFSLLREWRDSLIAPMVAHAINNGCLVILLWTLL